jgi:hypothetical protein|tara:strand:+ start:3612 stop:3770 length:159 start_codon:yes stop_codon:yes gene_type:complete
MSKRTFNNKGGQTWEWEETPEVAAAIAALHQSIRSRKLKEEDDELGYDTSGK